MHIQYVSDRDTHTVYSGGVKSAEAFKASIGVLKQAGAKLTVPPCKIRHCVCMVYLTGRAESMCCLRVHKRYTLSVLAAYLTGGFAFYSLLGWFVTLFGL
jgi:hypothetical protein